VTEPPPLPRDARFVRPDYSGPWLTVAPHGINWLAFGGHLSGWVLGTVLLLVPCLFILPRYEEIMKDFNAEVPASTRIALGAARLLIRFGILLAPVAVAHALLVGLWYPRASVGAKRFYRLCLTLCVCAVFALVIFALFLPIIAITDSLTGGVTKK
jgi:uncharacterized membrane protein